MKKIRARQLILKNIHAIHHTRNLITKKNSRGSKIPLPAPITFLMVRPLGRAVVCYSLPVFFLLLFFMV